MVWTEIGSLGPFFAFGTFILRCMYWAIPWTPIEWKLEVNSVFPPKVKWPSGLKEAKIICKEFGIFSPILTVAFIGRVIATILIWGMIFHWIPLSMTIFKCMLVYQGITAFVFRRCFRKVFNVIPGGYFRSINEESEYYAKKGKKPTYVNSKESNSEENNTFTGSLFGDIYLFHHLFKN